MVSGRQRWRSSSWGRLELNVIFRNAAANCFFLHWNSFVQLILIFLMVAFAQISPAQSTHECLPGKDCFIEFNYLSNQKTDPFVFGGMVVDEKHPRWREYRKALQRFPDVQSCLLQEEATKAMPNLLRFDWDHVGTGGGAEVCGFRVFSSLGEVKKIEAWLDFHGFTFAGVTRVFSESYQPTNELKRVSQLTAVWAVDQYRTKHPSLLATLTGVEFLRSYKLVVEFNQSNKVVGVGVVTPSN